MINKFQALVENSIFSKFLIYILALIGPLIFTNLVYFDETYNLPKTVFVNLIVMTLLYIALLKSIEKRRYYIKTSVLFLPFIAFISSQIIASIDAINKFESINQISLTIFQFLITILIVNYIDDKKDLLKLIYLICIAASVTSIIAIFQFFGLFGFEPLKDTYDADTFGSVMGHANFASAFLITVIPLMFVLIFSSLKHKKFYQSLFLLINLTLSIYCLSITFTRSSWIGLFFSIVFLLFIPELRKPVLIVSLIIVILAASFGSYIKDHEGKNLIQKALSSLDLNDDPVKFRIYTWTACLHAIKDYYFNGTGGGNFNIIYPKYRLELENINTGLDKAVTHAHNDYLEFAIDYGLIGFFSFFWLICSAFALSVSLIKHSNDSFIKYITLGTICGIAALLVDMLFNFSFHLPASNTNFFILIGILASLSSIIKKAELKNKTDLHKVNSPLPNQVLKGPMKKIPIILLIPIFFVGLFYVTKPMLASYYTNLSMFDEYDAYNSDKPEITYDLLQKAGKELDKALFLSGRNADLRYLSSVFNNFLGNYDKSLYDINVCISLSPFTPIYYCMKGIDLYNAGNFNSAEESILISLKYDRLFFVTHAALGNIYRIKKEYKKAIEEYQFAQTLKPNSLFPKIGIATVSMDIAEDYLVKKKDSVKAVKWFNDAKVRYEKILKIEDDNIKVLNNIGVIEFRLGNFNKAKEYFQKAEEIAPNHPSTNINLGQFYDYIGEKDKAIACFKKVLKLMPGSPLRFRLAQLMNVPVTGLNLSSEKLSIDKKNMESDELNKLWFEDNFELRMKKIERQKKFEKKD
jgi:O-antigen ligase/tetratricopeptide (TPR) repeat protein